MDFFECVLERRTCRRFKQDSISAEDLNKMVDAARYAPTGYNKQPVRLVVISSPAKVAETFAFSGWLTGRPGDDEKPAAYIVVMTDNDVASGLAAPACATYAVMLAAHALGYGSCWHGAKEGLKEFLGQPDNIEPRVLISLGKPAETAIVHDGSDEWQVRKDDDGTIHLGKFAADKVVLARM